MSGDDPFWGRPCPFLFDDDDDDDDDDSNDSDDDQQKGAMILEPLLTRCLGLFDNGTSASVGPLGQMRMAHVVSLIFSFWSWGFWKERRWKEMQFGVPVFWEAEGVDPVDLGTGCVLSLLPLN